MRTKTILLGAAIVAAGALSSMAQSNVFSVNTVGYYTLSLSHGFQVVANQLDLDGTGTNNTLLSTLGTNLPNGSKIFVFSGGAFSANTTWSLGTQKWIGTGTNAAALVMQPGQAFFLQIPAAAVLPVNLTIVGNVLGTNGVTNTLTTAYPAGFSLVASKVPVAGGVSTGLGLTPNNGDFAYQFNPATQAYGTKRTYSAGTHVWVGGEPTNAVGGALMINGKLTTGAWVQNFIIQ
jgi:hypothetical protein